MTPSHRLWRDHADDAEACLAGDFVRGLARGDLDREAFRIYVAQDAFFLASFFGAYAIAAARCGTDLGRATMFHELMGGILEEMRLHRGYASSLDIDLERVEPLAETSAYTDFLGRTAWSGDLPELVAAMVPCMRLYAWLGRTLADAPDAPADGPYRQWIDTYADPAFEQLAERLEAVLDDVCGLELPPRVARAYAHALRCERAFFAAPLRAAADGVRATSGGGRASS